MITGVALILIAIYVAMPKAIMITLCVFGGLKILLSLYGGQDKVQTIRIYRENSDDDKETQK